MEKRRAIRLSLGLAAVGIGATMFYLFGLRPRAPEMSVVSVERMGCEVAITFAIRNRSHSSVMLANLDHYDRPFIMLFRAGPVLDERLTGMLGPYTFVSKRGPEWRELKAGGEVQVVVVTHSLLASDSLWGEIGWIPGNVPLEERWSFRLAENLPSWIDVNHRNVLQSKLCRREVVSTPEFVPLRQVSRERPSPLIDEVKVFLQLPRPEDLGTWEPAPNVYQFLRDFAENRLGPLPDGLPPGIEAERQRFSALTFKEEGYSDDNYRYLMELFARLVDIRLELAGGQMRGYTFQFKESTEREPVSGQREPRP